MLSISLNKVQSHHHLFHTECKHTLQQVRSKSGGHYSKPSYAVAAADRLSNNRQEACCYDGIKAVFWTPLLLHCMCSRQIVVGHRHNPPVIAAQLKVLAQTEVLKAIESVQLGLMASSPRVQLGGLE